MLFDVLSDNACSIFLKLFVGENAAFLPANLRRLQGLINVDQHNNILSLKLYVEGISFAIVVCISFTWVFLG